MKIIPARLAVPVDRGRRALFAGMAAFGAALYGSAWKWPGGLSPAEKALISALREPESAAHVGRKLLELNPAVFGRKRPASQILPKLGFDRAGLMDPGADTLRRQLGERIRFEFGDGRTVNADGWILSSTEAWLCVLAAKYAR